MQLVLDSDLWGYVVKHGMLTEWEVLFLTWLLVEGLRYLHAEDVAHRDESTARPHHDLFNVVQITFPLTPTPLFLSVPILKPIIMRKGRRN